MPVVISLDVLPLHAQVALLDATWQDYPDWSHGEERVAVRAPSLVSPDMPPYPGFAVATRPDTASGRQQMVRVEVWAAERPGGLQKIYDSVLQVGRAGILVGNAEYRLVPLTLPGGSWPLEIWADSELPSEVSRVAFVLPTLASPVSGSS